MKKLFGIGLSLALIAALIVPSAWALDKGPATIDLNAQAKYPDVITKKDKKHVPNFPHHKHQDEFLKGNSEHAQFKYTDDYTCSGCHHTSKPGEQPGGCLKCKDLNKMLDKVGGAKKFDKLYHKNCRDGCHKSMKKAKKKAGPTKCKACHG